MGWVSGQARRGRDEQRQWETQMLAAAALPASPSDQACAVGAVLQGRGAGWGRKLERTQAATRSKLGSRRSPPLAAAPQALTFCLSRPVRAVSGTGPPGRLRCGMIGRVWAARGEGGKFCCGRVLAPASLRLPSAGLHGVADELEGWQPRGASLGASASAAQCGGRAGSPGGALCRRGARLGRWALHRNVQRAFDTSWERHSSQSATSHKLSLQPGPR